MTNLERYDRVYAINVDIQNDFCPGGALGVDEGDQVVPVMNQVNQWVRDNNGEVIFTADWHPRKTVHFAEYGGPWPPHCIQHTAGAAFPDDLLIEKGDTVAKKGMNDRDDGYSGFTASLGQDSRLYLNSGGRYGIDIFSVAEAVRNEVRIWSEAQKKVAVVIGGLATDYCVKATVMDALGDREDWYADKYQPNIGVFVVKEAIRAVNVNPGDGDKAIAEMKAAGAVFIDADELVNDQLISIGGQE